MKWQLKLFKMMKAFAALLSCCRAVAWMSNTVKGVGKLFSPLGTFDKRYFVIFSFKIKPWLRFQPVLACPWPLPQPAHSSKPVLPTSHTLSLSLPPLNTHALNNRPARSAFLSPCLSRLSGPHTTTPLHKHVAAG